MTVNTYSFQDQVVVVTGGSHGIGRAIARAFLDNGASVVVTGRNLKPLEESVAGYPGERTLTLVNDISEPAAGEELVAAVKEEFGRIDVVVSNAGIVEAGDLVDMDVDKWHQMRAINVDGFVYLARAVMPELVNTGGNLVAVSSVSGLGGDWGQAGYAATKHAVSGFVRSLALDYGEKGVRVNAVAPAFTHTRLNEGSADTLEDAAPYVNRVALGRLGQPEDIAPAVLFLASQDAGYITGHVLNVDGGTNASNGQAHV
ncbi:MULTISPECIES: SDR family NAD(P)-dependent oxidoreductase [Corynebacterium]|uniref:SDR family NAD(P)-dependent oxidoreductase n=1 Tax=Corynebacterium TaxID=1716 RepID=UPI00257DFD2D|nr:MULTISPECIES: SDR family oxidoreductase [Corynebacterium]MDN6199762.1 SDR family oxidoreductase [Corynebacterium flavescens]MDN6431389.1 SDR family oxidoreductase [Corynebacterium flavescens]MDN6532452.1 SDR family oxidoreductase [Corynebacterium flavescens]MDN6552958.1 SDR family oxidoreductase [Corynebacterium flavescens]MDN6645837.1 SDR family oxidoreductase [Corynebacterium flavescens]